jgi:hypothetical protein
MSCKLEVSNPARIIYSKEPRVSRQGAAMNCQIKGEISDVRKKAGDALKGAAGQLCVRLENVRMVP